MALAALCSSLVYGHLRCCSGLPQVVPAWFFSPSFSAPPSPILFGNVCISAVTLLLGGVGLCQLNSSSSSHRASLCSWFLWMPFEGAGLFSAAAPVGSGDAKELGRLQCVTRCVTLAAAFCSCPVLGKVAANAPLELHAASRDRRLAQRLSLGLVPKKGRPA